MPLRKLLRMPARVPFSALCLALSMSTVLGCNQKAPIGLTFGSPDRTERVGTHDIRIEVLLEGDDGKTIPNVTVTAVTSMSKDHDTTNSSGRAFVNVVVTDNDSIDFHFVNERGKVEANKILFDFPRENPRLTLLFKIDKGGSVRLAEVAY